MMLDKKWLILYLGTAIHAISVSITSGFAIYSFYLQKTLYLSIANIGFIIGIANIGPIFTIIFWTKRIEKYGERNIISLGLCVIGLILLFISTLNITYCKILCAAFLISLFHGIAQAGGSAIIIKWFDKSERSIAFGIRQSGTPIGFIISAGILPTIIENIGINYSFCVQGLFCILISVIFYLLYACNKQNNKTLQNNTFLIILKNKAFIKWSAFGFFMTSFQFIISGYLVLYLTTKNIDIIEAGFIMSVISFVGIISRIGLPFIDKKYFCSNHKTILFYCIFVSGISSICLAYNILYCLLFIAIFGFGWFGLYLNLISESVCKTDTNVANSISLTINQIAICVAPILFGSCIEFFSFNYSWIFLGIILLIFSIKIKQNT